MLTFSRQLRTLGSTLLPPKAAISPSCRGIWMHSCSSACSWCSLTRSFASATNRNTAIRAQHTHHGIIFDSHWFSTFLTVYVRLTASPCRINYYYAPLVGVRSSAMSMFVCLSVCLLAYLKSKTSKLHEIFYTCSMEYVMYFRFCGWRHVSP